jgi:ribonuclease P protein component
MTAQQDERFPKSARLVRQKDFDRVFVTGAVASDSVLVIHGCSNDQGSPRLGLSVSKRVGNSPERNRWKRLIREAFRKQKYQLPQALDLVVRPKKGAVPDYRMISNSMAKLCRQLERRLVDRGIPPA